MERFINEDGFVETMGDITTIITQETLVLQRQSKLLNAIQEYEALVDKPEIENEDVLRLDKEFNGMATFYEELHKEKLGITVRPVKPRQYNEVCFSVDPGQLTDRLIKNIQSKWYLRYEAGVAHGYKQRIGNEQFGQDLDAELFPMLTTGELRRTAFAPIGIGIENSKIQFYSQDRAYALGVRNAKEKDPKIIGEIFDEIARTLEPTSSPTR